MPTCQQASVWSRSVGGLCVRASLEVLSFAGRRRQASRGPTKRPGVPSVLRYLPSMTMRWDPILTAAIAAELSDALSGARLKGIFLDHGAGTLHAYFRDVTVFIDLAPSGLGVEVLDKSEPPDGSRTFPCTLAAVEHISDERVLVFVLTRIRGRGGTIRIVVEFVPGRSNATVVEGEEWTVRHILVPRSGTRAPRIGSPYPKPLSERRGVETPLSLQDWLEILEPEETLKARGRRLLHEVAFTSPVNAPALLGGTDGPNGSASLETGYERWLNLRASGLGADTGRSPGPAYILECEWGDQPYPVELPGYGRRTSETLLEAVEGVRRAAAGAAAILTPSRWTNALEDALRAVRKKRNKLNRELGATPDPQALRIQGDMILAHLHLVRKGAAEVTLPDFEGTSETIVLDPALSPQGNAERFYDRGGRAERARARLPALIQEAESHVVELSGLLDRVRAGDALHGRDPRGAFRVRNRWSRNSERPRTHPSLPALLDVRGVGSAGRTRIQSQRSTDVQALCTQRHLASCETFGRCTRRTPVERGRDAAGSGSGAGSEPRRSALQGTNLRKCAGRLDEKEVRA